MMGSLERVLREIRPGDRVLDVGGGLRPLYRADVVLDSNPIEALVNPIGEGEVHFTPESWIVHDVNDKRGFPFADKEFDFVFCSHLLEDIRDPILVCKEMERVGKRGYIETPSRAMESAEGIQSPYYTGFMHHRWFIEDRNGTLVFTHKSPMIHEFPFLHCSKPEQPYLAFFWDGEIPCEERLLYHPRQIALDLIDAAAKWQPGRDPEEFRQWALRRIFPHEYDRSIWEKLALRTSRALLSGRRQFAAR